MKSFTALNIFNEAHERARGFLTENAPGRKDGDDLRAAVIFGVAAVDVFFRVKILNSFKKNGFRLCKEAQEWIYDSIAKKLFGKSFDELSDEDFKENIKIIAACGKPILKKYVESTLESKSFQNLRRIDECFVLLGEKPEAVWGKALNAIKRKEKKGRSNYKQLLNKLFERRHQIVHHADIFTTGRSKRGKPQTIKLPTVRKWLNASNTLIKAFNDQI